MTSNYHTVDVWPTIAASVQHAGAASDTHVLFDWTAFNIPRGPSKLTSVCINVRGTDGADQASNADIGLVFAKANEDGTAPTTLGDLNAAVDTGGWFNNIIGSAHLDSSRWSQGGDLVYSNHGSANLDMLEQGGVILQGRKFNEGYDRIYVAGIAKGSFNFSTAVETTAAEAVSELATAIIGGTSSLDNGSCSNAGATTKFAVGDILHAEDNIVLGEVASLTNGTITFRHDGVKKMHGNGIVLYDTPASLAAWKIQNGAGAAGDLADGDEIYNVHPITFTFGFER